jgi:hypothetical protein
MSTNHLRQKKSFRKKIEQQPPYPKKEREIKTRYSSSKKNIFADNSFGLAYD